MRAGVTVLLCVLATPAGAHHSASRWTSFHRERYLVCIDDPASRTHCVGPHRAPPSFAKPAGDSSVDAVYFNVRAAVPALRGWLDDPDKGIRAEAAYALAHLGDTRSTAKLVDLVRALETQGYGSLWDDTLAALAVLDPARASAYATDFMSRASNFRISMPGGSSKLVALDYIIDPRALPTLEAIQTSDDHAECRIMATRVRLDPALRAKVRTQLTNSYSGTWLAGCANDVLAALGRDADDIPALVRHLGRDDRGMDFGIANIAYGRILELLATTPLTADARALLAKGLRERSTWPHVADPTHANYAPHFVALHRAALGETRGVFEIIDGDTDAAWLAAYWALRLRTPGAADHVAALMARSLTTRSRTRGDIYREIRARTLDAFADAFPADPRWAVMMLDLDRDANERALYRFSRLTPAKACAAVTAAARAATADGTEHALLGLTVLGARCLPHIEALFLDGQVDAKIRGAALEFLAVLESPKLCDHLARARAEGVWRPAIERAELLAPPCATTPQRRVDQPLPPRAHKQGT
jgi:hypothetical protein